jgi:hypothetical protein
MDAKITPEEVKKWYEASGFAPTFGVWVDFAHQQACPFFARFSAANPDAWANPDARERKDDLERFAEETARKVYGPDYTLGFIHGWDGYPLWYGGHCPEYIQGYEDGERAAVEILGGQDEDNV